METDMETTSTDTPPPSLTLVTEGERKKAEVEAAARAAGLEVSGGAGATQLLRFADQLNSEELRLMELPPEVLQALKHGERVVIRGEPGEDAVLCTDDRSYDLRVADTSNSLLVIPSLSYSQTKVPNEEHDELPTKEVTMCLSSYYELRPCRPKTGKLGQLLAECPYRGPEYEQGGEIEGGGEMEGGGEEGEIAGTDDWDSKGKEKRKKINPQKYTFSHLLDVVQASEKELSDSLHKLQALLIDGYWRVLDADYAEQAMQYILTLLEEQDWHWSRVPLNATCLHLHELLPRFVIEHCLKCYGTEVCNAEETGSEETYYELSAEKVCQFYAVLLLRQAGKFNFNEFMESWQQSVPLGMDTALQQLRSLALMDMTAAPPVIWYFPASTLPRDPAKRFSCLFAARERWTHSDIEPFIQDLATPTQSLNALLLKYARVSTGAKGVKTYNAKRTSSYK